jgi:threonylcarbamoyladenosine tRNA methylthiotransferase MtaB
MGEKVSHAVKEKRSGDLISLSSSKHREFLLLNRGKQEEVLFERSRSGEMITGYTGNYIRVEYPWDQTLAGTIKKVMLKELSDEGKMSIDFIDKKK